MNTVSTRGRTGLVLFLICAFSSSTGLAADALPGLTKGEGIVNGATTIYPVIGVEWADDDNLFRTPSNEFSSTVLRYNGGLGLEFASGPNRYTLGYIISAGRYDDFDRADYEDQRAVASATLEFNPRNTLDVSAEIADLHDNYGAGRTENLTGAPNFDYDEYQATQFGATYGFGAEGSTGRLEFDFGYYDKEYENNRGAEGCADRNDRTDTSCLDRDTTTLGVTFYYSLGSNTALLAEIRNDDINYAETDLDGSDTFYLAGVTWEASNNTTGTLKLGREERDPDSAALSDFSGTTWEAEVEWRPRSYSTVTFRSISTTEEPEGTGDFRERSETGINWTHEWGDRVSTSIDASLGSLDFGANPRSDDIGDAFVSISYKLSRLLSLRAEYRYATVDSNLEQFEFRRNLYSVGIWGTP